MAHFISLLALLSLVMTVCGSVLQSLVDVKGNGAIREVRIMYDLYENGAQVELENVPVLEAKSAVLSPTRHINLSKLFYKPSLFVPWHSVHLERPSQVTLDADHELVDYHPQFIFEQSKTRPKLSSSDQLRLKKITPHNLVRGRPLYAEVDFVPKYIPQMTYQVAISVTLPAHIRGRPWMLGWHQEIFPIPTCRLCTNTEQSFTLPVTLFLPDDGWCPEGRVPTIWKIEAIARESASNRLTDQTDMIIAYGYDELRQLSLSNDPNSTRHCRGINEAIVT